MTDQYRAFYRAAYNFHDKWTPPPETDQEWEQCAMEIVELSKQGGEHKFLVELLGAVYTDIGRQYEERR
jgi:hypothetical protein